MRSTVPVEHSLYPMRSILMPAIELKSSAGNHTEVPNSPKVSWPGLALASSISSATDFAGSEVRATRTMGVNATW